MADQQVEDIPLETEAPEEVAQETVAPEEVAQETVAPEEVAPEEVAQETEAPEQVVEENDTTEDVNTNQTDGEDASEVLPSTEQVEANAFDTTAETTEVEKENNENPKTPAAEVRMLSNHPQVGLNRSSFKL